MPSLSIRLDPAGAFNDLLRAETEADIDRAREEGKLIHLGDDAEMVVTGITGGMQSGAPSVMLGLKLPDGKVVIAETSWRLFATAFHSLAGKFGTAYPDMTDMDLLHDGGTAGAEHYKIVPDNEERFAQCEHCGERETFVGEEVEGSQPFEPMWWLNAHYAEKHPGISAPGVKRCDFDKHVWVPVGEDTPVSGRWEDLCQKCGELR